MTTYFTDREFGSNPAITENFSENAMNGFIALIESRIKDDSFGYKYPQYCSDGNGPCGCERGEFETRLAAEIPNVTLPLKKSSFPQVYDFLDVLEFCARAVGNVIKRDYHSYMRHYHLEWDRTKGLQEYVNEINLIFSRNSIAFKMDASGQVLRILPKEVADSIKHLNYSPNDPETNQLLKEATSKITSPKLRDRKDALEKIWDAFERIKTLPDGSDKKQKAQYLIRKICNNQTEFQTLLETEFKALTEIGNSFRIRHSEVEQVILETPQHIDYLFARMLCLLRLSLGTFNTPAKPIDMKVIESVSF